MYSEYAIVVGTLRAIHMVVAAKRAEPPRDKENSFVLMHHSNRKTTNRKEHGHTIPVAE